MSKGSRRGIKRYFCHACGSWFSSKRRPNNLHEIIFKKYVYKRQILKYLVQEYNRSIPWVRKQIHEYEPLGKVHNPRAVIIVCDATFYGKRKDKLGTLVFKDITANEVLVWKHINSETITDYKHLLQRLLHLGYTVQAIIIDGKRGLYKAFKGYSIQMCHFHQRKIMYRLTSTTQTIFTKNLEQWYQKHKEFLNEKSISETTEKEQYTHPRVRAAYRSLTTNLPYLFPMSKVSRDPRSDTIRRHHVHPKTLGRNIKIASQKENLNKRVTSHIFSNQYLVTMNS